MLPVCLCNPSLHRHLFRISGQIPYFQIICSCCEFFKYRRGIIPICITVRKISQSFRTAEYFDCNFSVQICKCSCNSNFTQRIFAKAVCIVNGPGYCLVIICLSANLNIDCGRKCTLQFADAFCGLWQFRCYIDISFSFEFIQRPVAVIFSMMVSPDPNSIGSHTYLESLRSFPLSGLYQRSPM